MLKTILFPQLQKSLGVTRRPFPENYGEIPKMDFINLPLPNVKAIRLLGKQARLV